MSESQSPQPLAEVPPRSNPDPFDDLLRRVRAGDPRADQELWDLYYPAIHREVRARLYHKGVRRVLDSADVCQSVFGSFYQGARAGQFELGSPRDLFNLLFGMARNKVLQCVARQCAGRRNPERLDHDPVEEVKLLAHSPSPSEQVAVRDLAEHFLALLPESDRRLAVLYAAGYSWEEIASQFGGRADTLRIRLMRALNKIRPQETEAGPEGGQ